MKSKSLLANQRKVILLTLCCIALLFVSKCTSKKSISEQNNQLDSVKVAFKDYLDSIPTVVPPLNFRCGLSGATRSAEEFEEYRHFMPKDVQLILGRVAIEQQDFTYIIYGAIGDDVYPTLCSYAIDGKLIDSIQLDSGCGGADETMTLTSFAEVRKDMTIVLTDTVKLIHYPDGADTYVLDSISVNRFTYIPGKDGRFAKTETP